MNINVLKNKAYKRYKKIEKIYCPYLKTYIVFNAKGFWHLIYSSRNKKRDLQSQKLRFQLLDKAVKILKITTTLQELQVERKVGIIYFGFIAITDIFKIKIIIKKVGNGKYFFWSVIPNWRTRRRERLLFKGCMEKD